jgi:hypothetical protein
MAVGRLDPRPADDPRQFVGAGAQAGVDGVVGLVLELKEDEESGRRKYRGDHRRENQGQAQADRDPLQLPPSFRSR